MLLRKLFLQAKESGEKINTLAKASDLLGFQQPEHWKRNQPKRKNGENHGFCLGKLWFSGVFLVFSS